MGGLTVNQNVPAPWYDFEMLKADTGELFLHFKVPNRLPWPPGRFQIELVMCVTKQ